MLFHYQHPMATALCTRQLRAVRRSTSQLTRAIFSILFFMCLMLSLNHGANGYTEVFPILKTSDDTLYAFGNQNSDFYPERRDSLCTLQWSPTHGSTTDDNDDIAFSEIFYVALIGSGGLLYAVGSTGGNVSEPDSESATQNVALVVCNTSVGSFIRRKQYGVPSGISGTATSIVQKEDRTLVVDAYGSSTGEGLQQTVLLEIDPNSLELTKTRSIEVIIFGSTGGPELIAFVYEADADSIVGLGNVFNLGILFRCDLATSDITVLEEFGSIFKQVNTKDLVPDGSGSYYVAGSSSSVILRNSDLSTDTFFLRPYVIRFDGLSATAGSDTAWVRQFVSDSGSDITGNSISIDPSSNEIVVSGQFTSDISVIHGQTSNVFNVSAVSSSTKSDVLILRLEAESGNFVSLSSSEVSTVDSNDKVNVHNILSSGTMAVGGALNNGIDRFPGSCDITRTTATPTPSPSTLESPSGSIAASASVTSTITATTTVKSSTYLTVSFSCSVSSSPSVTPSASVSSSTSASSSVTPLSSISSSVSITLSTSPSVTPTGTASVSLTQKPSRSQTAYQTLPTTLSTSASVTPTGIVSISLTQKPSDSQTVSPTLFSTRTLLISPSVTLTGTAFVLLSQTLSFTVLTKNAISSFRFGRSPSPYVIVSIEISSNQSTYASSNLEPVLTPDISANSNADSADTISKTEEPISFPTGLNYNEEDSSPTAEMEMNLDQSSVGTPDILEGSTESTVPNISLEPYEIVGQDKGISNGKFKVSPGSFVGAEVDQDLLYSTTPETSPSASETLEATAPPESITTPEIDVEFSTEPERAAIVMETVKFDLEIQTSHPVTDDDASRTTEPKFLETVELPSSLEVETVVMQTIVIDTVEYEMDVSKTVYKTVVYETVAYKTVEYETVAYETIAYETVAYGIVGTTVSITSELTYSSLPIREETTLPLEISPSASIALYIPVIPEASQPQLSISPLETLIVHSPIVLDHYQAPDHSTFSLETAEPQSEISVASSSEGIDQVSPIFSPFPKDASESVQLIYYSPDASTEEIVSGPTGMEPIRSEDFNVTASIPSIPMVSHYADGSSPGPSIAMKSSYSYDAGVSIESSTEQKISYGMENSSPDREGVVITPESDVMDTTIEPSPRMEDRTPEAVVKTNTLQPDTHNYSVGPDAAAVSSVLSVDGSYSSPTQFTFSTSDEYSPQPGTSIAATPEDETTSDGQSPTSELENDDLIQSSNTEGALFEGTCPSLLPNLFKPPSSSFPLSTGEFELSDIFPPESVSFEPEGTTAYDSSPSVSRISRPTSEPTYTRSTPLIRTFIPANSEEQTIGLAESQVSIIGTSLSSTPSGSSFDSISTSLSPSELPEHCTDPPISLDNKKSAEPSLEVALSETDAIIPTSSISISSAISSSNISSISMPIELPERTHEPFDEPTSGLPSDEQTVPLASITSESQAICQTLSPSFSPSTTFSLSSSRGTPFVSPEESGVKSPDALVEPTILSSLSPIVVTSASMSSSILSNVKPSMTTSMSSSPSQTQSAAPSFMFSPYRTASLSSSLGLSDTPASYIWPTTSSSGSPSSASTGPRELPTSSSTAIASLSPTQSSVLNTSPNESVLSSSPTFNMDVSASAPGAQSAIVSASTQATSSSTMRPVLSESLVVTSSQSSTHTIVVSTSGTASRLASILQSPQRENYPSASVTISPSITDVASPTPKQQRPDTAQVVAATPEASGESSGFVMVSEQLRQILVSPRDEQEVHSTDEQMSQTASLDSSGEIEDSESPQPSKAPSVETESPTTYFESMQPSPTFDGMVIPFSSVAASISTDIMFSSVAVSVSTSTATSASASASESISSTSSQITPSPSKSEGATVIGTASLTTTSSPSFSKTVSASTTSLMSTISSIDRTPTSFQSSSPTVSKTQSITISVTPTLPSTPTATPEFSVRSSTIPSSASFSSSQEPSKTPSTTATTMESPLVSSSITSTTSASTSVLPTRTPAFTIFTAGPTITPSLALTGSATVSASSTKRGTPSISFSVTPSTSTMFVGTSTPTASPTVSESMDVTTSGTVMASPTPRPSRASTIELVTASASASSTESFMVLKSPSVSEPLTASPSAEQFVPEISPEESATRTMEISLQSPSMEMETIGPSISPEVSMLSANLEVNAKVEASPMEIKATNTLEVEVSPTVEPAALFSLEIIPTEEVASTLKIIPTVTPSVSSYLSVSSSMKVAPVTELPSKTPVASGASNSLSPTVSLIATVTLSPSTSVPCPDMAVINETLLAPIHSFQRVRITLQLAGPALVTTCNLTAEIVDEVFEVGATNTLSEKGLWIVTVVRNGPLVVSEASDDGKSNQSGELVDISTESNRNNNDDNAVSVEEDILFRGSVIVQMIVYMDVLSVKLAKGSFQRFVNSQEMVRAMTKGGFNDVEWVKMIGGAVVLDEDPTKPPEPVTEGNSTGSVTAVAVSAVMVIGMLGMMLANANVIRSITQGGAAFSGSGVPTPELPV